MRLSRRLTTLEEGTRFRTMEARPSLARVFLDGELLTCTLHAACDLDIATGEHHQNVIHLSFDTALAET